MLAQEIDPEIGSEFPESTKIEAGMRIDVCKTETFTSKKGFNGVSVTDKRGKLYFSTSAQVVGLLTGKAVADKIAKASDGALTIFFKSVQNDPKFTQREGTHLEGSYFP